MSDPSDDELVAQCRAGDDQAFAELVRRYQHIVFGLIVRTVGDRSRAEDLAQDVFLRIHRGLPYFRGQAKLSTWIYRIVLNLCTQERSSRRPHMIPLDASAEAGRTPLDPGGPDPAFSDLELRDRLQKAMARLPARYRVLVAAHYLKGVRYEDIAEAMDLPLGTVKTHLYRAKAQLRALLTETEGTRRRQDDV
jgi:RNA polymerase sigma-70 factor, ECF subfamily